MQKRFYTKEDGGFESMGATVTHTTSKSRLVLVFLFLIIGAGLLFVGVRLLGMQKEETPVAIVTPTPEIIPTDTPIPTDTATPSASPSVTGTPSPTSSKSLTISVLNGSGVSGAAGDMSSSLKELGYTVSFTGNADAFTYEGITVKIKKSKSSQLVQLRKDVGTITPVSSSSATLAESTTVDAQVIVGK